MDDPKIKKGFVLSLKRLPIDLNQLQDQFYDFLLSLEQFLSTVISRTSIFLLVPGNLNTRDSSSWKNDYVTREHTEIEALTFSYGLSQLVSNSTHILLPKILPKLFFMY